MPFPVSPHKQSGKLFSSSMPEDHIIAHIDGGARGNPGPAGYGVHIQDASGNTIAELSQYLGHKTNNFAEYSALVAALEYAVEHHHPAVRVVSDSELLVRQMQGVYKVKSPDLKVLYDQARSLVRKLEHFEIKHVLREKNRDADRLANAAMDSEGAPSSTTVSSQISPREYNGIVRNGVVELLSGDLPEGTLVKVKIKR